ncbi:STAS/SEC14 domain-containing protein [Zobellia amurskyensis]|uniref:STAS/SEC14 domain-containing protein n=1 Tax=Zobellia amurskyensis TaxID=248905 RepID=A0A7X2ZVN5_9FLAO|nr:STAS/SEC14 domain-containing protein [Zobellia amurskyensis]MUH37255.1 STAS/SEC14 domain-containing protein [Zobellia amurskyensis]
METPLPIKHELLDEHDFGFAKFWFYPNYIVGEFAEGADVSKEDSIGPITFIKRIYSTTVPFIYISNRKNSYSMDPMGYKDIVDMFPNLIGMAIVSDNKYRRMIATLEKMFIKKPIGVFHKLEEAYEWATQNIEELNK